MSWLYSDAELLMRLFSLLPLCWDLFGRIWNVFKGGNVCTVPNLTVWLENPLSGFLRHAGSLGCDLMHEGTISMALNKGRWVLRMNFLLSTSQLTHKNVLPEHPLFLENVFPTWRGSAGVTANTHALQVALSAPRGRDREKFPEGFCPLPEESTGPTFLGVIYFCRYMLCFYLPKTWMEDRGEACLLCFPKSVTADIQTLQSLFSFQKFEILYLKSKFELIFSTQASKTSLNIF